MFGSVMRGVCFSLRTPPSFRLEAALLGFSCWQGALTSDLYLPFLPPSLCVPATQWKKIPGHPNL